MNRLRTLRLFVLSILLLLPFLSVSRIHAAGEFKADYDVQYAIAPSGKTIVTQHVTLTNQLPNFYPAEYSLLLDSDKISNIIAYDDGGVITPAISVKDGKTHITLNFNVKTIGMGKSSVFSLRYEHSGIANKAGNIWEIYVPGVVNDPDIGAYDVTLSVPPTFGPASYLSPLPARGNTWNKDQMIRGGIAGAYGTSQQFNVTLSYALTNDRNSSEIQEIALPPDTAYQEVAIRSLEAKPETVIRDDDGNWIARYTVPARQTLSVKANMIITTYLSPRSGYQSLPLREQEMVREQEYWETNDPRIQALARTYTTPRAIYNYVVSALSYDYSKINAQATRLGAVGSLNNPKAAVCMEFADLFIAIARAAGIPARRIVGYAYTNNPKLRPLSLVSDILHAWPEYYDRERQLWIPIDPTWANTTGGVDYFTKMDFNHLVFAINGTQSSIPFPAGYYRNPGSLSRDVNVEFYEAKTEARAAEVVSVIEFPDQVGAGTSAQGIITVSNKGSESAYNIAVSVVSEPGTIRIEETIPELLPFATVRIPITSHFTQSFKKQEGKITARINDAMLTKAFTVQPLYWLIGAGVLFLVLAGAGGIALVRYFLWKTSKKH